MTVCWDHAPFPVWEVDAVFDRNSWLAPAHPHYSSESVGISTAQE